MRFEYDRPARPVVDQPHYFEPVGGRDNRYLEQYIGGSMIARMTA